MNPYQAAGQAIRHAGPADLAQALRASRADTLATFSAVHQALAAQERAVPQRAEFNPPLWELGHVGWFQEYWVTRFTQRQRGAVAVPDAARSPPQRADADALYDSSHVPHASRWRLPLPDADRTREDLVAQIESTLALLQDTEGDDAALYFFRLVLLHEDMHHEAALYMAQALGLDIARGAWQPQAVRGLRQALKVPGTLWQLGSGSGSRDGFVFDNECGAHGVPLPAFDIDSRVVCWAEFMPFVEAGGYSQPRWWSEPGRRWLAGARPAAPQPRDPGLPVCHVNAFEAEAWCGWAGRRLPSEAEWECAALTRPQAFDWGAVWEWTASAFTPYPGFVAHPYRDYSAPWFGSRRVLRGASFATQPRMHHPCYRNFFSPERRDIFGGFRSCAQ